MSRHGPSITVTLRKVSTGYKILAFCTDDMNGAYAMSQVLIASPAYSRCYAVATGWEGNVLFEVRGAVQTHPQAMVAAPQPTHGYTLPPASPTHPQPQHYAQQQHGYRAVLPPLQIAPARASRQEPVYDVYAPEPAPVQPQWVDSGYGVRMLSSGGQKR